jgi:hypothetical protein
MSNSGHSLFGRACESAAAGAPPQGDFMDRIARLPDRPIEGSGPMSGKFLESGVKTFAAACRRVREMPYGYNSDRDDPATLFKENKGSCTTKHAAIALLAEELELPVFKKIGIYAMTEEIVTGTGEILRKHNLPYIPMVHCFLASGEVRVDLTEGNDNGKNRPIDEFLFTEKVDANISAKDEYLLYRKALKEHVLSRNEFEDANLKSVLHAREDGIALLKSKVEH